MLIYYIYYLIILRRIYVLIYKIIFLKIIKKYNIGGMRIYDITINLINNQYTNHYCFNNSIINIGGNKFMIVYRNIIYNIKKDFHPWSIWWNGFSIFKEYNPELFQKNGLLLTNNKHYADFKYRNSIAMDKFTNIDRNYDPYFSNPLEYDSTGIAIFEYTIDNGWKLLINNNNIFQNEMNHDTRLIMYDNNYLLTYNMFLKKGNVMSIKMMKRKLIYSEKYNMIYLGVEQEMLEGYNYGQVEKNCIFDPNKNILYNINGIFTILMESTKTKLNINIKLFQELQNLIGKDNIIFSLSTPSILYKNKFLALGHVKIAYKNKLPNSPIKNFVDSLDFSKIYKHGKFIYLMFFFEYDNNYEITKLSNSFIPTIDNNHLPYYLVFPMSLILYGNQFIIGYGEGDTKTKILTFETDEVDKLLIPVNKLNVSNYDFMFLTPKYFSPDILHLGYFSKLNCGDDAFIEVFRYLNKTYYPHLCIDYKNVTNSIVPEKYKLITLGGGDVINDYFIGYLDKIKNIHCVSVGIAYESKINLLDKFNTILLRYSGDLNKVTEKYPDKIVKYFPDLVFLFDRFVDKTNKIIINEKIKIGISLCRNYYNKDFEPDYFNFICGIVEFIKLLINYNYQIYLIPFGINEDIIDENDIILNKHIKSFFLDNEEVIDVTMQKYYDLENYVYSNFYVINSMDFMICSRFHSHIFSMVCRVPFVSLSCSRKCKNFMIESNLGDNYYPLITNSINIPIEMDFNNFFIFIQQKINNSLEIKKNINNTMDIINIQMDEFIIYWKDFVLSHFL
jgi:predicted GH43/DUF377 family glycosyl hydrolase